MSLSKGSKGKPKKGGSPAVDADRLAAAVEAAGVEDQVGQFLAGSFGRFEDLIVGMKSALRPDDYLVVLDVCRDALGGKGKARTLPGPKTINRAFFHHGDLRVAGNLVIQAPFALTGSLIVDGCIRDCGPDSIVAVGGDVTVHSLYTDGEFQVGGSINAKGVVYGYYNDNTLSASRIKAKLVIEDEHDTQAKVVANHHFDIDTYQQGSGEGVVQKLSKILIDAVFFPKGDGYEGQLDKDRLFKRLMKRQPVFR